MLLLSSLYDLSIWLIYDAWDGMHDADADSEDEEYFDERTRARHQGPFRPDWYPSWARWPDIPGRHLLFKVADCVQDWPGLKQVGCKQRLRPVWSSDDFVPTFLCARSTSKGEIIHPSGAASSRPLNLVDKEELVVSPARA